MDEVPKGVSPWISRMSWERRDRSPALDNPSSPDEAGRPLHLSLALYLDIRFKSAGL
jgi:hypothetical protein